MHNGYHPLRGASLRGSHLNLEWRRELQYTTFPFHPYVHIFSSLRLLLISLTLSLLSKGRVLSASFDLVHSESTLMNQTPHLMLWCMLTCEQWLIINTPLQTTLHAIMVIPFLFCLLFVCLFFRSVETHLTLQGYLYWGTYFSCTASQYSVSSRPSLSSTCEHVQVNVSSIIHRFRIGSHENEANVSLIQKVK